MPPTFQGMTRAMVQGIPVWKAADGGLFAYDTQEPPLRIGSGEEFAVDWEKAYAERLATYRAAAAPRARASGGKK